MEPNRRQTLNRPPIFGVLLACALMAGVLSLAWLEHGSAFARSLSQSRPVLTWLALDTGNGREAPDLFLAVYQPTRRTLELVHWPGSRRMPGGGTLNGAYAALRRNGADPATAARHMADAAGSALEALGLTGQDWKGLRLWRGEAPAAHAEPALAARQWILRRTGARLWPALLESRGSAAGSSWPWFDRMLLALELQRLRPEAARPAELPPEDQVGPFMERLLNPGAAGPAPQRPTVEVLNASARPGAASRVKNILRSSGADVMSVDNAVGARTVVYDRTGDFANAAAVLRMLDCTAAQAMTQVDLKRLVDVTVVIGEDCSFP